jgi:hypothetical protein
MDAQSCLTSRCEFVWYAFIRYGLVIEGRESFWYPVRSGIALKGEQEVSKAFICGFAVGVALLIVAGVGASRLKQRDTERATFQAEVVDATPVRFGELTEQERTHSKLYTHYLPLRGNHTITALVAEAKGQSRIVETGVFVGLSELPEPRTTEEYFGELSRMSDIVIRGRVTTKVSQISEDDGFLFTDYDVTVIEVLKTSADNPLETGAKIIVTRPGGKVLVDGVIVKAGDDSFTPFPVNNHDLLLFLKLIPQTRAYRVTSPTGSFELQRTTVRPLTAMYLPPGVLRDADSFLQTARAVCLRQSR